MAENVRSSPSRSFLSLLSGLYAALWTPKNASPQERLWRRITILTMFSSLIVGKVCQLVGPFFFRTLVNELNVNLSWGWLPLGLIMAYGIARFGQTLFTDLKEWIVGRAELETAASLSEQAAAHLHQLSLRFHLERKLGALSRVIDRGAAGTAMAFRMLGFALIPVTIEILLMTIIVGIFYGVFLASLQVIFLVLFFGVTIVITKWRMRLMERARQADDQSSTVLFDGLINYETVKFFGNEQHEIRRYQDFMKGYVKSQLQVRKSLGLLNIAQASVVALGFFTVTLIAFNRVESQQLSLGDFVLLNTYMIQLFMNLNGLGFALREATDGMKHMADMLDLTKEKVEISDTMTPVSVPLGHSPEISFDHVSFWYNPERRILEDITFTIPAGKRVAVVGSSGSGKTTIARLLFRFYDPTEGVIRINGQDIRTFTQEDLRRLIAVVPQDTVLFNDTLLYNIAYGRIGASREDINEVVRLAHLDHFISQLPEGLGTIVGERGLKLSGGEKQRVAIARALLKGPKVFIFDEATSALDTATEKKIQENIMEVSADHTTLIIAHRLSTIVDAHKIVVLEAGRIVEEGTHHALLKKGGMYAKLWDRQSQGGEKEGSPQK